MLHCILRRFVTKYTRPKLENETKQSTIKVGEIYDNCAAQLNTNRVGTRQSKHRQEKYKMKLSLISLIVFAYTVITVAWICYTQTSGS
ncbi:hypothetical protein GCM10011396_33070 [Undibacterium terreum]|uniref:Uncharacterized protein n=1 Tax=Undibacterium terreum TaxID=1224302 RepID=A0A916UQD5_9BURK|nr:hypothetical protein GCM10011396_33070 [Undibacterium terreum]